MPPHQKPAIAVTDLKAAVDRKAIVLTWSGAGESKEIVGYDVYSSRSDLTQPACPGCPMEFVKVGTLAIKGDQASGQPHRFSFSAAPGYRYRFKVRPYLATGNSGPESNTVMIEFHYP